MDIKSKIALISLSEIVQATGARLTNAGQNRLRCLCPLHEENTPSFFIKDDKRFKCYGCDEYGDVIDFVKKYYGYSFKETLSFLGIEQGAIDKTEIIERERKKKNWEKFQAWQVEYRTVLSEFIFESKKRIRNIKTSFERDEISFLFHLIPVWEHHYDILLLSDKDEKNIIEKLKLMQEVKNDLRFGENI